MKIIRILIFISVLIPNLAFGAFAIPWEASSTSQGWIFPNKINGTEQTIVSQNYISTSTTASSTFANGLNLTKGCFSINNSCLPTSNTVPGSNTQIIYNGSGVYAASSAFTWDNPNYTFTLTGPSGTSANLQTNSSNAFLGLNYLSGPITHGINLYTDVTANYLTMSANAGSGLTLYTDATHSELDVTGLLAIVPTSLGVGSTSPYRYFSVDNSTTNAAASIFKSAAGGYSALTFTSKNSAAVGALTTFSGSVLLGRENTGLTGSNGEIEVTSNSNVVLGYNLGGTPTNVGIASSSPYARLSVRGNGATTGTNFQTTDSNNVPLFTILDSGTISMVGNVGIGTTTPTNLLTLEGVSSGATLSQLRLRNSGTAVNTGSRILLSTRDTVFGDVTSSIQSLMTDNTGGLGNSDMVLSTTRAGSLTEFFRGLSSGFVGINTATPKTLLHVSKSYTEPTGGIASTTQAVFSNNNAAQATSSISILSRSSASSIINFGNETTEASGQIRYYSSAGTGAAVAGSFIFNVLGTDKMVFDGNGSLGVGTSTPLANLQVTTTSANATTSVQLGKPNQNKGTCLTYYDSAGTPVYAYIPAGTTAFTLTSTKLSGCQN